MKKLSIILAVGFMGLALCGGGYAATVTTNVSSEAGIPVFGPSAQDLPIESPSWGESTPAIPLTPVDPLLPQDPTTPQLKGAIWITTSAAAADLTVNNFRWFQDSFTPPCTASNLAGTMYSAANNSEDFYLNGALQSPTAQSGLLNTFAFKPVQGENSFDFVVQTDGVAAGTTNLAGLIYNAVISYDLPNVTWRPPIVKTKRTIVKNGTTLPIKFTLSNQARLLRTVQSVYLSISGPGVDARFDLGVGARSLRFATGNGQYIANFKTKDFNLQVGSTYTVSVNDLCTAQALGTIQMQIFGKK